MMSTAVALPKVVSEMYGRTATECMQHVWQAVDSPGMDALAFSWDDDAVPCFIAGVRIRCSQLAVAASLFAVCGRLRGCCAQRAGDEDGCRRTLECGLGDVTICRPSAAPYQSLRSRGCAARCFHAHRRRYACWLHWTLCASHSMRGHRSLVVVPPVRPCMLQAATGQTTPAAGPWPSPGVPTDAKLRLWQTGVVEMP